jgi:hypothetical protein
MHERVCRLALGLRWRFITLPFFLEDLISWSSKHQLMVSHSKAESEYRIVAKGIAKAYWLR